jgi:hypothetical protein
MGSSSGEIVFTKRQMRNLLGDVGFVDIKVTTFKWIHPAIPLKLINLVENVGSFVEQLRPIPEFSASLHICAQRPAE